MIEYQEYQPLSGWDIVGVVFFLLFLVILLAIYLRVQYINSLPLEEEIKEDKFELPEIITFDYSIENLIGCYYKGDYMAYASFIDDRVHYHWVKDNSTAIPSHTAPQNHTMTVENNLRRLVLKKFKKPVQEPPKRQTRGQWDITEAGLKKENELKRRKDLKPKLDMDIQF